MRAPARAATRAVVALALLLAAGPAAATGERTLVYRGGGQGTVVFDGRLHAGKGYVCNDCHRQWRDGAQLFATRKQARIDRAAHGGNTQCFACHDGKVAPADCARCHRANTATRR